MTRVRVRIGAWYTGEFDLVNRTDDGQYVVRDEQVVTASGNRTVQRNTTNSRSRQTQMPDRALVNHA